MIDVEMRLLDKIQGCLIGGAVGDALGYPIEFMSLPVIQEKYGVTGLQEYSLDSMTVQALISDDTQMSLFTANALIVSAVYSNGFPSLQMFRETVYHAYLDWYKTQICSPVFENKWRTCWLMDIPNLYANRAPGTTCMAALESGEYGSIAFPLNASKGCGGVMRVAPVGCFFKSAAYEDVVTLGAEAAAVTHGNTLGTMPAGMLALLIRMLVYGDNTPLLLLIQTCCKSVEKVFAGDPQLPLFLQQVNGAISLAHNRRSDAENISELGQGWTGDEALCIALYCFLRYFDDFSTCIRVAANHSGDSDSTAAITGNILGAYSGLSGIDLMWRKKLEHYHTIIELSTDLYEASRCADRGMLGECLKQPSFKRKYIEMHRTEPECQDAMEAAPYFFTPAFGSKLTLFVNPRKAVRKTVVGKDGSIHGFPGIENPELIVPYCDALDIIYPHVQYTAWYSSKENRRRMIWEIHPDGEYWRDDDGFGEEDDTEVDLYSELDDEGNFTRPFRIYRKNPLLHSVA